MLTQCSYRVFQQQKLPDTLSFDRPVYYARQFNVVAYGDGDGGAGSGIRTRVTSLEGWCINPYTMPA